MVFMIITRLYDNLNKIDKTFCVLITAISNYHSKVNQRTDQPTDEPAGWLDDWLTDWRNRWSRVRLEKPVVTQLVNTFPISYGKLQFITVFTKSSYWILSWFQKWIYDAKIMTNEILVRRDLSLASFFMARNINLQRNPYLTLRKYIMKMDQNVITRNNIKTNMAMMR